MNDAEKLAEIHRLLNEAYNHYFAFSDGYCKSSEGHIAVRYGDYWDRSESGLRITGVEVYSYALGPSRNHHFDSIDDALDAVREWHAEEMASGCRECEGTEADSASCWLCLEKGRVDDGGAGS